MPLRCVVWGRCFAPSRTAEPGPYRSHFLLGKQSSAACVSGRKSSACRKLNPLVRRRAHPEHHQTKFCEEQREASEEGNNATLPINQTVVAVEGRARPDLYWICRDRRKVKLQAVWSSRTTSLSSPTGRLARPLKNLPTLFLPLIIGPKLRTAVTTSDPHCRHLPKLV